MPELHDELIVFDGLIIANWGPEVFADMRRGGITAANCTCSVWEGFEATMANLARFQAWFRAHADLILQIRTTEDIHCAKREGRTGIVLGFQNVSAFEDQLGAIGLFKELGVGIVQLAYNTQNLVGAGCYESKDPGLSDFGREVVAEMNRVGMLCDLSHVGPATSRDTILVSTQPVAYSHCLPAGLKAHPRNKSDEELRFIADHGGFVGVTMFPPLGLRRTFQTSQLFPGMTVLENMMAGLHLHTKAGLFASALRTGAMREEEAAAAEKAFEALRFVGMEGFADRPGNALRSASNGSSRSPAR